MRTIKYTAQFKRDLKREKKSGRHPGLDDQFLKIINKLIADKPLPVRCYDHALIGNWSDHRDCHIKPNLVLIYRQPDNDSLELVRLGSHSELGL